MIQRVPHGPCLGERVSALVDGSMAPDAATRAMAHVVGCPTCAEAVEVERLTVERLRSLPPPVPSGDLMVALLRLGEPGNPVPLRRRPVPVAARAASVAVAPPAGRAAAAWPGTSRPQGTRRPGDRGGRGTVQRRAVLAAAGALGVGVLAWGGVGLRGASLPGGPTARPPVAQVNVEQQRVHEAVLRQIRNRGPAASDTMLSTWSTDATTRPLLLRR